MLILSLLVVSAGPWQEAAETFSMGPVPASLDLRNMQNRYIVERSCSALDACAERRHAALAAGDWQTWRSGVREAVREGLGALPFGEEGGPLNVRPVSRRELPGYVLENVLFDSLPGLDVNASIYIPPPERYPPPWQAAVVAVGHSSKTRESYQIPAQVFAQMGYVAVTFDPPGVAGEKQAGNDHFNDGVRCYLTGHSSNRYFVIDALRCVDYLVARGDIDMSRGVAMTGVSGGGITTMFAALLDDRIAVAGPACCAVSNAVHPVLDMYAPCPETLAFGRFTSYDDADLLAAAAPKPVLLMAGAEDEVFTEEMSRAIAEDVEGSFDAMGLAGKFEFFLDGGGHGYSVAMAKTFVAWMDRWLGNGARPERVALDESLLEMLPADALACHPRQERNMFSINRDLARELAAARPAVASLEDVRAVANATGPGAIPEAETGPAVRTWFHHVREVLIEPEPGIRLPSTYFAPAREDWRGGAVLYFDERGRWTDLRRNGMLARMSGFLDANTNGPAVLTVDVRGWGDTRPADMNYDIAGWGCRERWTAYVSAALGDPVLAMRIRDGLAALAWLRSLPGIETDQIVVGGRGMGGVVALHVAAIDAARGGRLAGTFAFESLGAFQMLAEEPSYTWDHECFLPEVLRHYDLPELTRALPFPVLIARPLGAAREPAREDLIGLLYESDSGGVRLLTRAGEGDVVAFVRKTLLR